MPIVADPIVYPPGPYVSVEALLIDWLTTTLGYTQVVDEVPRNLYDLLRTAPVVVVERFGGNDPTITIDIARVDVDVYASTRQAAQTHADLIRTAMRTQLAGHMYRGTVVKRVETITAPVHAPYDSQRAVRRYLQTAQLTLHQYSGVA